MCDARREGGVAGRKGVLEREKPGRWKFPPIFSNLKFPYFCGCSCPLTHIMNRRMSKSARKPRRKASKRHRTTSQTCFLLILDHFHAFEAPPEIFENFKISTLSPLPYPPGIFPSEGPIYAPIVPQSTT